MKTIFLLSTIATYFLLHPAYSFSQGTAINTTGATADNSAIFDAASNSKGLLLPRMTTTERNAIVSPAQSLLIFNTTTQCFEYFDNTVWQKMYCSCFPPAVPTGSAGSSATQIQFTANWNVSSGATGYYLDVSSENSFITFVPGYQNLDVSNVLTYDVTGLTCNTPYYYRVRAYNTCGATGNSDTITISTSSCGWSCGSVLAVSHSAGSVAPETKSVNYGTVSSTLGGTGAKCWITQNLGADNEAGSPSDATAAAAGWYWQFNRKQGYTSGPTPAWTITAISEDSHWLPANDPCTIELGAGWRIPTSDEWNNADINGQVGGWDDYIETFNDVLKLHAAGHLIATDGSSENLGISGTYWGSTQTDPGYARVLYLGSGFCMHAFWGVKANGFSIRCLKD